jgi:hypothetical protein
MKLYQYRGGGYDGCIWEWNFFLFKDGGEEEDDFYDIYSSGNAGISTQNEARKYIKEHHEDEHFYEYDLDKEDDIKEFEEENNSTNVGRVCDLVNTYLEKEVMFFHCTYCGAKVYPINHHEYPSYFYDDQNYSGDGGIGIVFHACLCEECYHNRCDKCGSIIQPPDVAENDGHDQYLCGYCRAKK